MLCENLSRELKKATKNCEKIKGLSRKNIRNLWERLETRGHNVNPKFGGIGCFIICERQSHIGNGQKKENKEKSWVSPTLSRRP